MFIEDTGLKEEKDPQCDLVDVWVCEGGTNGVTEKEWVTSAVGGVNQGGSQNEEIDLGFRELDECGLLQHESPFDVERVLTSPTTTQVNTGTPPTNNDPDQHQLDFYVKSPSAAALRLRSNGFHSGAIAIGKCLGKLKESHRYIRTDFVTPDALGGNIGAGIFRIRTWAHDPGQNGGHTVQWDLDGTGNFVDIPEENVYVAPPVVQHLKAYLNKETGVYEYADGENKGQVIQGEVLCYNPCESDFDVVVQEPLAIKDVKEAEPMLLCDKLKDGTEITFVRHFQYIDGVPQTPIDKDLNGVDYVTEGQVTPCNPQCNLVDVWLCDASTGVPGVTEQIWDASAVGGNASSEAITVGFTQVDECGFPAHENAPDTTQTLTSYQSTNINVNPPDNTPDQHILESYVKLPSAVTLGLRAGGIHAGLFAMGPCNGKLKESFRYENSLARTPVGYVGGAEIVHVKSYIHDPTQNGSHTLEYSLNGGQNWITIPDEWLFTTPPTVQKIKAYYNKTDRKYYRADDLTEIVETETLEILCDDPCKGDLNVVIEQPLLVEQKKQAYTRLGVETINITSTSNSSLTPPVGTVYALVQTIGDCDTRFTVNGTNPNATNSNLLPNCQTIKLGCSTNFIGDIEDIEGFRAEATTANCTNRLQVTYYGEA